MLLGECLIKEGSGRFLVDEMEGCWLCYCSLHVRPIDFDLSYDTAALSFWKVLHFLFLIIVLEQHY